MPELPEIETLARELRKKAVGLVLSKCWVRHPEILKHSQSFSPGSFENQTVMEVERFRKFLYFKMQNGCRLWFHLGMTGQILWQKNEAIPARHDHVLFKFQNCAEELWFRDIRKFGEVFLTTSEDWQREFVIGPDALEVSEETFVELFKRRTGPIKSLLLNQKIIAGLGNIYANESLYRAGIHPKRRPVRLPLKSMQKLHGTIREVLQEAIGHGGSSIDDYRRPDGQKGSFQKYHRVYGRHGEACFSCGEVIKKIELSGRSAFYCSQCQK